MSTATYETHRARVNALFVQFCEKIGIRPLDFSIVSHISYACFATAAEAEILAEMLRKAGEVVRDVHHWDPAIDTEFDDHQFQVSWGA